MKKIVLIVLIIMLMLSLCSCTKSSETGFLEGIAHQFGIDVEEGMDFFTTLLLIILVPVYFIIMIFSYLFFGLAYVFTCIYSAMVALLSSIMEIVLGGGNIL